MVLSAFALSFFPCRLPWAADCRRKRDFGRHENWKLAAACSAAVSTTPKARPSRLVMVGELGRLRRRFARVAALWVPACRPPCRVSCLSDRAGVAIEGLELL